MISKLKIKKIKIYFYIGNELYTNKYCDSVYLIRDKEFYNSTDIVKCEILFTYKYRRYKNVLSGCIDINDIFKEIDIIKWGFNK